MSRPIREHYSLDTHGDLSFLQALNTWEYDQFIVIVKERDELKQFRDWASPQIHDNGVQMLRIESLEKERDQLQKLLDDARTELLYAQAYDIGERNRKKSGML